MNIQACSISYFIFVAPHQNFEMKWPLLPCLGGMSHTQQRGMVWLEIAAILLCSASVQNNLFYVKLRIFYYLFSQAPMGWDPVPSFCTSHLDHLGSPPIQWYASNFHLGLQRNKQMKELTISPQIIRTILHSRFISIYAQYPGNVQTYVPFQMVLYLERPAIELMFRYNWQTLPGSIFILLILFLGQLS